MGDRYDYLSITANPRRKLPKEEGWIHAASELFVDSCDLTGQLLGDSDIRYDAKGKLLSHEGLLAAQKMSRAVVEPFPSSKPLHRRPEGQWLWSNIECNYSGISSVPAQEPGTTIPRNFDANHHCRSRPSCALQSLGPWQLRKLRLSRTHFAVVKGLRISSRPVPPL